MTRLRNAANVLSTDCPIEDFSRASGEARSCLQDLRDGKMPVAAMEEVAHDIVDFADQFLNVDQIGLAKLVEDVFGDLRERIAAGDPPVTEFKPKLPATGIPFEDVERAVVIEALKMSKWVQKDAAELLSLSPRVMNYKIQTLGIDMSLSKTARKKNVVEVATV